MKLKLILLWLLCFIAPAQAQFQPDAKINVTSVIVANNTTAIVIKAGPATLYGVEASNNGTAIAYIKLYNAATATCGSGTPVARYMIPKEASASLNNSPMVNGDAYVNGIVMCVVNGIADNDTAAPAASAYTINIHWKQGQQ